MALNNAAADAAVDAFIDTISPPVSATQRTQIHSGLDPLVRAIFAGIVVHAVVSPNGSGTDLNADGTPVTGTGKLL